MATGWERRADGEGRQPTPRRARAVYVESPSKGVKKDLQCWCYICNEEHPYHAPKTPK